MSKIHKSLLNVNEWLPLFGCSLVCYRPDGRVEHFGALLDEVHLVVLGLFLELLHQEIAPHPLHLDHHRSCAWGHDQHLEIDDLELVLCEEVWNVRNFRTFPELPEISPELPEIAQELHLSTLFHLFLHFPSIPEASLHLLPTS